MKVTKLFVALLASSAMTVASAQNGTDTCTTPDLIAGQGSFAFDNSMATTGLEGQTEYICYSFGTSAVSDDVWFTWTADADGNATISTCLSTFDTKIAAYPAGGCPTAGSSLACNDDSCGLQSSMSFPVVNGTAYTLQIGTFAVGGGGFGTLDISIGAPPVPPVNDDCLAASAIAGQGSFAFDNTLATTGLEGQTEYICYEWGNSAVADDVWYTWTADANGTATISTCTSTVDTKIGAYPGAGCPTAGSALACNDDACGFQSSITFPVTTGTVYTLQVGTFGPGLGGTGMLDILISPPPTNDDCSAPIAIAGQGSFPFNLIGATTGLEGQAEYVCYFFGSSTVDSDVWFSWTADANGDAIVSTCSSSVDTKIASYPAGGCPTAGSSLGCNDDSCGLQSQLLFPVTTGTSYMIQLGTFPGAPVGMGNMDISIVAPLTNDDCATPTAIAGQGSFAYDNTFATTGFEGQNEYICYAFGSSAVYNDVWFNWTSDATGPATISTCLSSADTKIAAYPAGGCPTTGSSLACNDDTCGLQSEITFNVVAGTTYLLQLGNFGMGQGALSQLDITVAGPAEPGTAYCFCDAGNSPCLNGGAAGNGCANGSDANGANLTGSGIAMVGADTLVLSASGLAPGQPGLYFSGTNAIAGGAGVAFGDGIRCAGQGVIRLGVAVADGTGNSSTAGFGMSISALGGVTAGDMLHYQLWYRDPVGTQCGANFNLTNGYTIQW